MTPGFSHAEGDTDINLNSGGVYHAHLGGSFNGFYAELNGSPILGGNTHSFIFSAEPGDVLRLINGSRCEIYLPESQNGANLSITLTNLGS